MHICLGMRGDGASQSDQYVQGCCPTLNAIYQKSSVPVIGII